MQIEIEEKSIRNDDDDIPLAKLFASEKQQPQQQQPNMHYIIYPT